VGFVPREDGSRVDQLGRVARHRIEVDAELMPLPLAPVRTAELETRRIGSMMVLLLRAIIEPQWVVRGCAVLCKCVGKANNLLLVDVVCSISRERREDTPTPYSY